MGKPDRQGRDAALPCERETSTSSSEAGDGGAQEAEGTGTHPLGSTLPMHYVKDNVRAGGPSEQTGSEYIILFHGCTQPPSLAQSASSIQSRGGRQVACRPVILPFTYSP